MAQPWANFNNGDTGAVVRGKLNTFNTGITADVTATEGTLAAHTAELAANAADIITNAADIVTNAGAISTLDAKVDLFADPVDVRKFNPLPSTPAYVEGQMSYNDSNKSFELQGAYPDVTLQIGEEMHFHVINNTPSTILNGQACREDGVSGGLVQASLALADTFDNARLLGVATHDILSGEEGILTTFGAVHGLDTLGLTTGVPMFLSDTIPGAWQETPPAIITQVGGVLNADVSDGTLFVSIVSNKNLPSVIGGLQGQVAPTDLYSVTTSPQSIENYVTEETIVTGVNLLAGVVTLPLDGKYRASVALNMTFPDSASTRTLTLEVYDSTNTDVIYAYDKSIPRDSTFDSLSFNWPFSGLAGTQYVLRIKADVAVDVTLAAISFDIESISLR